MKSKHIKHRGHMYAVVRKPESVEHLSPNSLIHAVHREYARQLKLYTHGLIRADVTMPGKLKFASLKGGVVYDYHGERCKDAEFERVLNSARRDRAFYLAPEIARNGEVYLRQRRINPVRQLAVTVFPAHACALGTLDAWGNHAAPVIDSLIKEIWAVFAQSTPYDILGFSVHPEESMLHLHVCYSVVDKRHRLNHEGGQRGQPARNFLGLGRIATLRLVEFGLWPESDATDIRETLERKTSKFGAVPIDWLLHETIDSFLEIHFRTAKAPQTALAYEIALGAYGNHARDVRAIRPDVLIDENAALRDELEKVRKRIKELEARQGPPTPTTLQKLRDIVALLPHLARGTQPPNALRYAGDHLVRDSNGGWRVSPALIDSVEEMIADPDQARMAATLRDALDEATATATAFSAVSDVSPNKNDQRLDR